MKERGRGALLIAPPPLAFSLCERVVRWLSPAERRGGFQCVTSAPSYGAQCNHPAEDQKNHYTVSGFDTHRNNAL